MAIVTKSQGNNGRGCFAHTNWQDTQYRIEVGQALVTGGPQAESFRAYKVYPAQIKASEWVASGQNVYLENPNNYTIYTMSINATTGEPTGQAPEVAAGALAVHIQDLDSLNNTGIRTDQLTEPLVVFLAPSSFVFPDPLSTTLHGARVGECDFEPAGQGVLDWKEGRTPDGKFALVVKRWNGNLSESSGNCGGNRPQEWLVDTGSVTVDNLVYTAYRVNYPQVEGGWGGQLIYMDVPDGMQAYMELTSAQGEKLLLNSVVDSQTCMAMGSTPPVYRGRSCYALGYTWASLDGLMNTGINPYEEWVARNNTDSIIVFSGPVGLSNLHTISNTVKVGAEL